MIAYVVADMEHLHFAKFAKLVEDILIELLEVLLGFLIICF